MISSAVLVHMLSVSPLAVCKLTVLTVPDFSNIQPVLIDGTNSNNEDSNTQFCVREDTLIHCIMFYQFISFTCV